LSSNLARQLQRQEIHHVEKERKSVQKKSRITKGEKFIYMFFGLALFFFSFQIVSNQASIYQMNKEIQILETHIGEQEKVVQELKSQVQDLSQYDRLTEEAKKLGLTNNRQNVKVVTNKK